MASPWTPRPVRRWTPLFAAGLALAAALGVMRRLTAEPTPAEPTPAAPEVSERPFVGPRQVRVIPLVPEDTAE